MCIREELRRRLKRPPYNESVHTFELMYKFNQPGSSFEEEQKCVRGANNNFQLIEVRGERGKKTAALSSLEINSRGLTSLGGCVNGACACLCVCV